MPFMLSLHAKLVRSLNTDEFGLVKDYIHMTLTAIPDKDALVSRMAEDKRIFDYFSRDLKTETSAQDKAILPEVKKKIKNYLTSLKYTPKIKTGMREWCVHDEAILEHLGLEGGVASLFSQIEHHEILITPCAHTEPKITQYSAAGLGAALMILMELHGDEPLSPLQVCAAAEIPYHEMLLVLQGATSLARPDTQADVFRVFALFGIEGQDFKSAALKAVQTAHSLARENKVDFGNVLAMGARSALRSR